MKTAANPTKIKGGPLQARLEFVREQGGVLALERVLGRLSEEDRKICRQPLAGMWYAFEDNERLDEAIAAEMGIGEKIFELIGERSALHNLAGVHRFFIVGGDPHALLSRSQQIYSTYYNDAGKRTYEKVGETKALLRTFDSDTVSKHDCLTNIGWHRKAIEMCGAKNVRVMETKCRAEGADVCEYLCQWD